MRRAAGEDEGGEEPDQPGEGEVAAPQQQEQEHRGHRHVGEAHGEVGPEVDDVRQLPLGHRVDPVPDPLQRAHGAEPRRRLVDVPAQPALALAGLADQVDQAQRLHLVGAAGDAVLDQAARLLRAELALQEALRPHAGKEVEQDLGQAELGAALGHH